MPEKPYDEDAEEHRIEQIEREATWLWNVARISIAYQNDPLIQRRDPLVQVASSLKTLGEIDGDKLKAEYHKRALTIAEEEIARLKIELEIASKAFAVLSKPPAELARALIILIESK